MSVLRERVWQLCGLSYEKVHLSTGTTVETLYGHQQGGRKGHNTKNRGKKGYRPVLCFIDETRGYLLGKLRKGETISGEEVAKFIKQIKTQLPGCVKRVLFRGDGKNRKYQKFRFRPTYLISCKIQVINAQNRGYSWLSNTLALLFMQH